VFKDAKNRWVRSRTVWNQHAYAITHVNEDGTIPKTSAWTPNWSRSDLNNYRQNIQGSGNVLDAPDLTAQAGPLFTCEGGNAALAVPVCNRGTTPTGTGVTAAF
jgi:hypothetical protein